MRIPDPYIIVIFGASGDLTRRKLIPALYELQTQKLLPANYVILGAGRTNLTNEQFRRKMEEGLKEHIKGYGKNLIRDDFLKRLYYIPIETGRTADYNILKDKLSELNKSYNTRGNYLFYLATPPDYFGTICDNLFQAGFKEGR